MRAYSNDLRQSILLAIDRGDQSLRQIAYLFSVSLSFLVRLLQRRRQTGSATPKPHAGGPHPKLDDHAVEQLLKLVHQQPDATLVELRDRLGIPCHIATIDRVLRRHRISRKKKTLHADEQDKPKVQAQRAAFDQTMASVDPDHLVFVDETGATTSMTRRYGRAPQGQRVVASAPGHWKNVTMIVGLRPTEVMAPFAFEGATDTPAFQTYVEEILVPQLEPGDVVVWDNLKPHKNAEVIEAITAVGAHVEPLPPYSPDKNPLEELFGKAKEHLRTVAARTTDTVITAMGEALDQITSDDISGWFQDRCAYAMR